MKPIAALTFALLLTVPALAPSARAADGKIAVVAAENFYGDIASQIGGPQVEVTSIMNNPDQDPHLFETTPGGRAPARGRADRRLQRRRLRPLDGEAAERGAASGPHRRSLPPISCTRKPATIRISGTIPPTMPAVAKAIAAGAQHSRSRACRRICQARLATFIASLKPLSEKIAAMRRQICRRRGHRERAGVRLHGAGARPDDAQRALPARDHERHRAERQRRRRLRDATSKNTRSACMFYNKQASEQDRAASGRTGEGRQNPGRRRDRDGAA